MINMSEAHGRDVKSATNLTDLMLSLNYMAVALFEQGDSLSAYLDHGVDLGALPFFVRERELSAAETAAIDVYSADDNEILTMAHALVDGQYLIVWSTLPRRCFDDDDDEDVVPAVER